MLLGWFILSHFMLKLFYYYKKNLHNWWTRMNTNQPGKDAVILSGLVFVQLLTHSIWIYQCNWAVAVKTFAFVGANCIERVNVCDTIMLDVRRVQESPRLAHSLLDTALVFISLKCQPWVINSLDYSTSHKNDFLFAVSI